MIVQGDLEIVKYLTHRLSNKRYQKSKIFLQSNIAIFDRSNKPTDNYAFLGHGDFLNSKTIIQDKEITLKAFLESKINTSSQMPKIEYVQYLTANHLIEPLLDPYILGKLKTDQKLICAYKTTHTQNLEENQKRITIVKEDQITSILSSGKYLIGGRLNVIVEYRQLLLRNSPKSQESIKCLQESLIWSNSLYLKLIPFFSAVKQKHLAFKRQQGHNIMKLKYQKQEEYVIQYELSWILNLLERDELLEVVVERQKQYDHAFSMIE